MNMVLVNGKIMGGRKLFRQKGRLIYEKNNVYDNVCNFYVLYTV